MSKSPTRSDLLAINTKLVEENAQLLQKLQSVEAELLALKSPPAQTETKESLPTEEPISTVHMVHILSKLGWEGNATAEFLAQFKIVRKDNWFSVTPIKTNRETHAFLKEINTLRWSKSLPGNWYKNTGIWMTL